MNRFTSWLALAATLSILGCKTTESDTVAPEPGPSVAQVTRLKPEAAKQPAVAPRAVDTIEPPAPPIEPQPRIAPILLRNYMGEEPAAKTREARSVGETRHGPILAASTPVQEVATVMAAVEAIPHSIAAILGSARAHRSECDSAATAQAVATHPERAPSGGNPFWSYATPVLTGLCAYILAPLLVDILKQRIQFARHAPDAGKPAQAA
jgi:hypothetical protein